MKQFTLHFSVMLLAMVLVGGATAEQPSGDLLKELQVGFESFEPGSLVEVHNDSGHWAAQADHAVIHTAHRRSGDASLRLLGGADREVVWTPASLAGKADHLEFWYERWTSRSPFAFQVDLLQEDQWKTVYNAPANAPVGSFKNRVSIPLPAKMPKQIRFRSTTPDNSGVMIDDLSIEPSMPKQIAGITARQRVVPLLLRNEWNPVFDVTINVQGNQGVLMLEAVEIALDGSLDLNAIEKVEVITSDSTRPAWFNVMDLANHEDISLFGSSMSPAKRMVIHGNVPLERGENHFLLSVKLKDSADVSQALKVSCPSVAVDGKQRVPETSETTPPLRIGHALRRAGDDDVNTYRIPGLATTKAGTLIAVYDVRYRNGGDLPGDIDVGMSRSVDGGRSWEPMKIIMDMGDDAKWLFDGIGDPAILVDTKTGTIWVAALWSHGNRAWHHSGQGTSPDQTGQLVLVRSDDDGKTWSKPIRITEQIKKPEWNLLFNGPGKGICMEDGTLVFAAQYQDEKRIPHSTIVYSQDQGRTWHVGTRAHRETTEAQVVEVRPGVLMLNCRYNKSPERVVMTTSDLGKTWQEHSSSKKLLIEPGACMASLIDVDQELGKDLGGWLLFSNPESLAARENITIKASKDGGNHWPQEYRLLLDEGQGAGYSCMTMIDEHTVGILYEGSTSKLVFQRFPWKDILSAQAAGTSK
ncbi:exo-alpha-sialidase [Bremerella sp.]|uniref:exo-alpha-sialidase n=1 Tax=Bremerella sp. TaxID=2795602 RepID=UPI00391D42CB